MPATTSKLSNGSSVRIEARDLPRLLDLCQPDVEFVWPPSLPYGQAPQRSGLAADQWAPTWVPLQPTDAETRRVFAL